MTREVLSKANELTKRIDHLHMMLDKFEEKAKGMDNSLIRMTSFDITCNHNEKNGWNVNQGELLMLISAFKHEIDRLEQELAAL